MAETKAVDAASWMGSVRERIEATLSDYFQSKLEEAKRISPDSIELVQEIETLTMRGGKRFRPIVLAAAFRAVRPDGDLSRALPIGASLEILQSYLLIHDDWMDQDDERRGGPAVHAAFRTRHAEHDANALAILAGDVAAAYALELALETEFPAARRDEALRHFVTIQKEVILGQHLDLTANPDVSRMHDLKTTSYTVRGPLLMGAYLGDASEEHLDTLVAFGNPVGEAFQLADDLLGTFGDTSKTGKPGDDLRHGKRTSLVGAVEKMVPAEKRKALDECMAAPDPSDEQVAAAVELIVSSGAKESVEKRLQQRLAEANAALDNANLDPEGVQILRKVAERLAVRTS